MAHVECSCRRCVTARAEIDSSERESGVRDWRGDAFEYLRNAVEHLPPDLQMDVEVFLAGAGELR